MRSARSLTIQDIYCFLDGAGGCNIKSSAEFDQKLIDLRQGSQFSSDRVERLADIACAYFGMGRATKEREKNPVDANIYFRKALEVWQDVKEAGTIDCVAMAKLGEGNCYYQLGDVIQAIECYQNLVYNWPDFESVWVAQYLIGQCYQELGSKGIIDANEASEQAKNAYRNVIEKYPKCLLFENAVNGLQLLSVIDSNMPK